MFSLKSHNLRPGILNTGFLVKLFVIYTLVSQFGMVLPQPLEIQKVIKEELLPGYMIVDISTEQDFMNAVNGAVNAGSFNNNTSLGLNLRYSLLVTGNIRSQYFAVDELTGVLSLRRRIDRELICSFRDECSLKFQVAARSIYGGFFLLVDFNIIVMDINDNPPEFTQIQFELNVPENAEVGRSFLLPSAFDRDTGPSNMVKEYRILAGPSLFGLKNLQGAANLSDLFLSLDSSIQPETEMVNKVLVGAIDGGIPPLTGTLTVIVNILDVNDNFPIFENQLYEMNIPEVASTDQVIGQVKATDADSGLNGDVTYSFSAQQPQDDLSFFRVDAKTGKILVSRSIEARAGAEIELLVEARDGGHPPKSSRTLVRVQVEDTINSVPEIIIDTLGGPNEGVAEVSEYAEVGKVVAFVNVMDADSGVNGQTSCQLSGVEFDLVTLDNEGKFKVELMTTLDREQRDLYNITLTCSDLGFPRLTATAGFVVKVLDENDHQPVFSLSVYEATVSENNSVGAFITQLAVTDDDIGSNAEISFYINGASKHFFDIDDTGKITAKISLDREVSDKILAVVVATDKGSPPLSSSTTITVNLLDVNDVAPKFSQAVYTFIVEEELPVDRFAGFVNASDTDLGINKEIIYRFQDSHLQNNADFLLGEENGLVRTNVVFDREQKDTYNLVVLAIDKGQPPLTGIASIIIRISDINDNSPYFLYPTADNNTIVTPHSIKPHTTILFAQARDKDSDLNARIIYSLSSVNISSQFAIDPNSGAVFIKDSLTSTDIGTYTLTIMANDQGPKQQRSTQIPLHIQVYFDNSTMFLAVESAALSKEVVISLVIVAVVMLIILAIAVAVLCFKKRRSRVKLNGTVPNSASTSSTAKLQGGYYIAPGVRGSSSSSFIGKQEDGTCNKLVQETGERTQTSNPYIVVLSRNDSEAPTEIIEISLNPHQNGLCDTLERNRIDDDRFSTFRSQEDILSPGFRYGSLRRQNHDNSPINKKVSDNCDDLSCDESTSDSGRGGSDMDVNNGAAAAKHEKARVKAGTPISIKSGISHRLSPLPQQERTLVTFRGESPNMFKFESDSDTLPRNSKKISSLPAPSPNKEVPKFGSGSASAFSGPSSQHRESTKDNKLVPSRHLPLQLLNVAEEHKQDDSNNNLERVSEEHPDRPSIYLSNSTYPRQYSDNAYRDSGLNSSHSLTRRDHVPRQPISPATEFTHHAFGDNKNTNNETKREGLIPDHTQFQFGSNDAPTNYHRDGGTVYNDRQASGSGTPHNKVNQMNYVPQNAAPVNYSNMDYTSDNAPRINYDNMENEIPESHAMSVEEDFLLPPYPEVEAEEEENLRIHPGYTDFHADVEGEKTGLFSKSRFESSA